jgi:hypothetical protein
MESKPQLHVSAKYATQTKHGHNRRGNVAPEYWIWHSMIQRCHNQNNKQFGFYGGRGIAVCREWRESYSAFFSHIGHRPSPKYSIDRIDNDRGYEPGNVRWATSREQARNTRRARLIKHAGQELSIAEWSRKVGIGQDTLRGRINRGWPIETALSLPAEVTHGR